MIKYYISEDYLFHHGIKGQKWGVRRYQNYDGTLTDAGKKKIAQADAAISRWNKELDKKRTKAETKLARATSYKAKDKALKKIDIINDYEKRANALNKMENPYIRKANETKKEQSARVGKVYTEYSAIDDYLGANKRTRIAGLFGGTPAIVGVSMMHYQQFRAYADIYMKEPADKFIERY